MRCLCPGCIASGDAAEKFDGAFQDSCSVDEVSDPAKLEELIHRTPGYHGWQQEIAQSDPENGGSPQGCLFQCLHCGKHLLRFDFD